MVVEDIDKVKTGNERNRRNLGPHGLGDPNDKSLRKVERDILIPNIMRDKARLEKCTSEVADFNKCCKENGLLMVFNCRNENAKMKECYVNWYYNEEFRQQCTEEYLEQRSEYRTTGIKKKRLRGKQENV